MSTGEEAEGVECVEDAGRGEEDAGEGVEDIEVDVADDDESDKATDDASASSLSNPARLTLASCIEL